MKINLLIAIVLILAFFSLGLKSPDNSFNICTSWAHHMAHSGKQFRVIDHQNSLDTGDKIQLLVNTSTAYPHMVLALSSSGESYVEIWAGTTVSNLGIVETSQNINLASSSSAIATITNAPTITNAGTHLTELDVTAGSGRKVGGTFTEDEYILNAGTLYLINTISEANGNDITIILKWYETTEIY